MSFEARYEDLGSTITQGFDLVEMARATHTKGGTSVDAFNIPL